MLMTSPFSLHFRHFLNVLSRGVFGGSAQLKKGHTIGCIAFKERSSSGNWHLHTLLDFPFGYDPEILHSEILQAWFHIKQRDTLHIHATNPDQGWFAYLTKPSIQKPDYSSSYNS